MTAPIYFGRVYGIVDRSAGDPEDVVAALWDSELHEAALVDVVSVEGPVGANEAARTDNIDYLAFVRADVDLPDGWLSDCISIMRQDPSTGAVGWSPRGIETAGLDLFVTSHAMLVRYTAFHGVAGFDPRVGGGLEDLDLCWRVWLAGWRVRSLGPLPAGHAKVLTNPEGAAQGLLEILASALDASSLGTAWSLPEARAARRMRAARRHAVQDERRRGDGEMLPLAHRAIREWAAAEPSADPLIPVLERFGAPERSGSRRRIAVVTADTLAARMAGPAIRAVQIARRLAEDHEVILATTSTCDYSSDAFEVRQVGDAGMRELEQWCDIFLFQGWVLTGRPYLLFSDKIVIADIYDPMHLEQLEQARGAPGEHGRYDIVLNTNHVLNEQIRRADFMLCASAKQRDFWLGQLAAAARVNPVTYDGDEALDRLLAIVPFGIGDQPPIQSYSGLRGKITGIGPDDKVVLWGGGVYNWFDPLTLVRAVDRLRHRIPELRLVFLGMKHPNPGVPAMEMAARTEALAGELGLTDKHVFFNREWVEFDERHNYLLDADLGVSTHLDHLETEFSFRTRILDYLWAELPIVATTGDSFATLIAEHEIGEIVPAEDVEALEHALERILADPERGERCRRNIRAMADDLRWRRCLEPLAEFCQNASRAPDISCPDLDEPSVEKRAKALGRFRDAQVAISYLRAGAAGHVVRQAWNRVRSRLT